MYLQGKGKRKNNKKKLKKVEKTLDKPRNRCYNKDTKIGKGVEPLISTDSRFFDKEVDYLEKEVQLFEKIKKALDK